MAAAGGAPAAAGRADVKEAPPAMQKDKGKDGGATPDVAMVWMRRDLRLDDNPALEAASKSGAMVVPFFVWEPEEQGQFRPGRFQRWWLNESLARLEDDLRAIGSSLTYVRAVSAARAVDQLLAALDVPLEKVGLFFNNLYDAVSLARDAQLKAAMLQRGINVSTYNADLLYEPWEVLGNEGQRFCTFEAFWKCLRSAPHAPAEPQPAPASLRPLSAQLAARLAPLAYTREELAILTRDEAMCMEALEQRWRPGSRGAMVLLDSFTRNALGEFSWERAKVDTNSTSQLSPHLHLGEISVRRIYHRVIALRRNANEQRNGPQSAEMDHAAVATSTDGVGAATGNGPRPTGATEEAPRAGGTIVGGLSAGGNAGAPQRMLDDSHSEFLRCLGLREWSRYLSFFYPFTHERSLLSQLRAVPWNYDQALFQRWRLGTTGYPLVDAAMRQLWSTGWLHNRMRMVVASFLVKHLLLPWQWGLRHFWEAQLDADLESDVLGWQYVSGCLADGHSFMFQIDLDAEARRFDPKGSYVRRWITQLSRLPTQYVHAPWRAPPEVLEASGVDLGGPGAYPHPVVDLVESRERLRRAVEQLCQMALEMAPPGPTTVPVQNAAGAAAARRGVAAGAAAGAAEGKRRELAESAISLVAPEDADAQSLAEPPRLGAGVLAPTLCDAADSPRARARKRRRDPGPL